jgi:hypothetical protein
MVDRRKRRMKIMGKRKCFFCGSKNIHPHGFRTLADGRKRRRLWCANCRRTQYTGEERQKINAERRRLERERSRRVRFFIRLFPELQYLREVR